MLEKFGKDDSDRKNRFIIRVGKGYFKDKSAQKIFESWTVEDYRKAIKVGKILKEEAITVFMDIFLHPNLYKIKNKNVVSLILGEDNLDLGIK